jgi:hypothetical protein
MCFMAGAFRCNNANIESSFFRQPWRGHILNTNTTTFNWHIFPFSYRHTFAGHLCFCRLSLAQARRYLKSPLE